MGPDWGSVQSVRWNVCFERGRMRCRGRDADMSTKDAREIGVNTFVLTSCGGEILLYNSLNGGTIMTS